jgi:hypothetical protein
MRQEIEQENSGKTSEDRKEQRKIPNGDKSGGGYRKQNMKNPNRETGQETGEKTEEFQAER